MSEPSDRCETSREDGAPLPPVEAAQVDPRAAAFMAGYWAAWDNSCEGHNSEWSSRTRAEIEAQADAALYAYFTEAAK